MMSNMSDSVRLVHGEDGASIVEYGLLIGLIALVCVAAMSLLGNQISNVFGLISTSL